MKRRSQSTRPFVKLGRYRRRRLAASRTEPNSAANWEKYCRQYDLDRGQEKGPRRDEPQWLAPDGTTSRTASMDPEIPLCWSDVPGSFPWRLAQERRELAHQTPPVRTVSPTTFTSRSDLPFADCDHPACALVPGAEETRAKQAPQAPQVTRWHRRRDPCYTSDMWVDPFPAGFPQRLVASILTDDPPAWLQQRSLPLTRGKWYHNNPKPDDTEIQPSLLPINTAPLAWVLVEGNPARALLDTGSIISIISRDFWMSLGSPQLWPCRPRAVAVDGDPIAMDGAQTF